MNIFDCIRGVNNVMMSKQQNKPMVGNLEYFKNGKKNRPTNISAIAGQP